MDIPDVLIEKMNKGKLVLFIGAGLSINAGYPSWNKLIEDILNKISYKEPKFQDYINALNAGVMTPIDILGKIEKNKSSIIEIFEQLMKGYAVEPTDVHKMVSRVSGKIITTNYDKLLEMKNAPCIKAHPGVIASSTLPFTIFCSVLKVAPYLIRDRLRTES